MINSIDKLPGGVDVINFTGSCPTAEEIRDFKKYDFKREMERLAKNPTQIGRVVAINILEGLK